VFWDSQGLLLAHFQKRDENVNSASYCEVMLKFRDAVHRKHPGKVARGVLLHHDNARTPHTARGTQERIQELQWQFLEHLPYVPDLAPSDFHLFSSLKTTLVADVSLMTKRLKWVRKCLRQQSKDVYAVGFRHTGKAMGQVYQCWWRICQEINVLSRFEYHILYVLYPVFVTYLLTLPLTDIRRCGMCDIC
jgi:hypothetical protein